MTAIDRMGEVSDGQRILTPVRSWSLSSSQMMLRLITFNMQHPSSSWASRDPSLPSPNQICILPRYFLHYQVLSLLRRLLNKINTIHFIPDWIRWGLGTTKEADAGRNSAQRQRKRYTWPWVQGQPMLKRLFPFGCSGEGTCSLRCSIEIIIIVYTITKQIRQDSVS